MKLLVAVALAAFGRGGAVRAETLRGKVSLPSIQRKDSASLSRNAKWWARVGEQVFYMPADVAAPMPGLSPNASDYYYAIGSHSALTEEMMRHRVGGEGRWHIFHLPEGPSMMKVRSGDRRESFSSLMQLKHEQVLEHGFPVFATSESYTYPGGQAALDQEKAAVAPITAGLFGGYLTNLTSLGDSASNTRSSFNPEASSAAASFLQQEFSSMGITNCLQKFTRGDKDYVNVVGYIPGQRRDTLTVGAHYDSRPYQGAAPGANDNGSGVAVMLSLAKAFTQAKLKPVRDLFFVGFAAEEQGMWGSEAFVPALVGKGTEASIPAECQPKESFLQARTGANELHHQGLVLDEVGWKSPKLDKPTFNLESRDSAHEMLTHLAQANALHNGEAVVATHSSNPFGSDHMSFIDRNLDGVLVINGDDEAYPAYHASGDSMDMVDQQYAAQLAKMVFGGMVRMAGLQV